MPRTFGEFGKARNSSTANKVVEYLLANDDKPRTIGEIYKAVASDLEKVIDLTNILMNLDKSGKIQRAGKDLGWLPKRSSVVGENTEFLDWSLLSKEELSQ